MNDAKYLLTYDGEKSNEGSKFAWFQCEEDLWEFVQTSNIRVIEAFHIRDAVSLQTRD